MQNTNDVQHIQTTIPELQEITDIIFAVEPIQPLGLIGAVGIAKTTPPRLPASRYLARFPRPTPPERPCLMQMGIRA